MSCPKYEFLRLVPRTGIAENVFSMLCVQGVGVMKDEEVKLEEIEASHTLGGSRRCDTSVIHT